LGPSIERRVKFSPFFGVWYCEDEDVGHLSILGLSRPPTIGKVSAADAQDGLLAPRAAPERKTCFFGD